jgi:hypothetical protein
MPKTYKNTITYEHAKTDNPRAIELEEEIEMQEYQEYFWKAGLTIPKKIIKHETIDSSPYSVDFVILHWNSLVAKGFTHVYPLYIPEKSVVHIIYDNFPETNMFNYPKVKSTEDTISIPFIENASKVFGNIIPLELK